MLLFQKKSKACKKCFSELLQSDTKVCLSVIVTQRNLLRKCNILLRALHN
ncbi:hypothetical protein HanRHA438_Chr17g0796571 [Helianthus annuus]|nr:hypothetical protein HanRHA438_Chr17g0796571 [Helianthus annuus]